MRPPHSRLCRVRDAIEVSPRHCEQSEAIQNATPEIWIASSQALLAMTGRSLFPRLKRQPDIILCQRRRRGLGADQVIQFRELNAAIEAVGIRETVHHR